MNKTSRSQLTPLLHLGRAEQYQNKAVFQNKRGHETLVLLEFFTQALRILTRLHSWTVFQCGTVDMKVEKEL